TSSAVTNLTMVSVLRVRLDSQLVASITLPVTASGTQTVQVALPTGALASQGRRNHVVQVSLDARDECLSNVEVRVLIRADQSYFHLEYRQLEALLDLGSYPRPFYNGGLRGQAETVIVVLPAKYSAQDVEAAGSVSAGLGQLTGNGVNVRV